MGDMWHPIVTCERCGQLHECTRLVSDPCSFSMLCHSCEAPLTVTIAGDVLARRRRDLHPEERLAVVGFATTARSRWTEEHEVS